jgi:hypothetical protein
MKKLCGALLLQCPLLPKSLLLRGLGTLRNPRQSLYPLRRHLSRNRLLLTRDPSPHSVAGAAQSMLEVLVTVRLRKRLGGHQRFRGSSVGRVHVKNKKKKKCLRFANRFPENLPPRLQGNPSIGFSGSLSLAGQISPRTYHMLPRR